MNFSQADIDRARAEGAKQEHERITAILSHPAAQSKPNAARQLILAGVPAAAADGFFAAWPQGEAPGEPILEALDKLFGTATKH